MEQYEQAKNFFDKDCCLVSAFHDIICSGKNVKITILLWSLFGTITLQPAIHIARVVVGKGSGLIGKRGFI